jgi:large subunit ribosomal protein L25
MEQKMTLNADTREQKGSTPAARLRKQGLIPAIIYGHKKEPVSVTVNAHDFNEAIHHGHRLMDLNVGKKKETIIVKDIQYDYLGKNIIHADLMRVNITDMVTVTVPVELKGPAKGAAEGGVTVAHASQLEIECRVTEIPEKIILDIKELGVGGHIFAKEIQMPEGAKLKSDPETLVVSCTIVEEIKTTEQVEQAEPIVPEVITKGKKLEEGEEGEAEVKEKAKEKEKTKEKE